MRLLLLLLVVPLLLLRLSPVVVVLCFPRLEATRSLDAIVSLLILCTSSKKSTSRGPVSTLSMSVLTSSRYFCLAESPMPDI